MLDRCEGAGGPAAGDLVRDLLALRPGEMRAGGAEMLSSAASHRAAQEVADEFAASPLLRPLILDVLRRIPAGDGQRRQGLFVMGARALLLAGSPLLADLFGEELHDLGSDEGARLFCGAVSAIFAGVGGGADLEILAGAADAIHGRVSHEAQGSDGARNGRIQHLRDALACVHGSLAGALDSPGGAGGGQARQRAETAAERIAETIGAMSAPQHGPPATASMSLWLPWFWPFWAGTR